MKINRMGNWDKINTREELITLLKGYKGILNDTMIDYLNSLIELEFSVIRDYISDNDRVSLAELEVYKRVAMYNIYYKALDLFKKSRIDFDIFGNDEGFEGLSISAPLGRKSVSIFEFKYKDEHNRFRTHIPDGYKSMRIGDISLYHTVDNAQFRDEKLRIATSTLGQLKNEKNPFNYETERGRAQEWDYGHRKKIREYENQIKYLNRNLSDGEKREIEITKQFHELLLSDYGLTSDSFEEYHEESIYKRKHTSENHKILVKKQPNLTIENHIYYL